MYEVHGFGKKSYCKESFRESGVDKNILGVILGGFQLVLGADLGFLLVFINHL
jgi:hypothetical protein